MKKVRNEVPEAMARAAAHWWTERADGTAHHNNRGGDLASVFAGILADTMNEPPKVGALERFEEILAEKIMTAEHRMTWQSIWVDYAPDRILAEAAEEAGISCNNFPWKTGMHIDVEKGEITVRIALGQPKKIYPEVTVHSMEELIRKIELTLIVEGQNDLKFKLGEVIRYTPHEVAEILRKHADELT